MMKLRTATASSLHTSTAKTPNISSEQQAQSHSAWRRPSQETQRPHHFAMPSHPHYTNSKMYLARAPLITSPNIKNGTTPSNSSVNLCLGFERSIQCLPKNRENRTHSWKKPWQQV